MLFFNLYMYSGSRTLPDVWKVLLMYERHVGLFTPPCLISDQCKRMLSQPPYSLKGLHEVCSEIRELLKAAHFYPGLRYSMVDPQPDNLRVTVIHL